MDEYSLLMLPASALMLFRPTVAPAKPCRVPREVREFMAPALELAVVPAAGREKREQGRDKERGEDRGKEGEQETKRWMCYTEAKTQVQQRWRLPSSLVEQRSCFLEENNNLYCCVRSKNSQ